MRTILVGAVGLILAALLASCTERSGLDRDARPTVEPARPRASAKLDREESLRRTEAVRRAVEELATRGVKTDDYLMNLIDEGETYKVSFVKSSGRRLKAELSVTLRQEDFEVLSVEGLGAEPEGDSGQR
jgi:hypothetical protein